jgi:hypothetical protein
VNLLLLVHFSHSLQSIDLLDVHVEWSNNGDHTQFRVTSGLSQLQDKSNVWLALGINDDTKMVTC